MPGLPAAAATSAARRFCAGVATRALNTSTASTSGRISRSSVSSQCPARMASNGWATAITAPCWRRISIVFSGVRPRGTSSET